MYRVIRHLATGGMGSVYDVEDTSVEKRYVLKTLHPQLIAREDLARRMRDEAKSLAKLQHPNIVDVITAGVTKDAQRMPFYVMERLVGQNLRSVLEKRGGLDPMHAYRIAIDVADALEHAHENAIVHRDVKPENIFLHRNANGGTTTKLLDFGIVRLLDRKASHTHGKFIGTLRYASPEQVAGREIGPGTDLYSLGCVLYEMLCGRGPFDDAGDQYAVGAAHATVPAPPLSRFMRVSPEVERIVAWALAKDPAQRPRDAFAFSKELRRLLIAEEAKPRIETVANVIPQGANETAIEEVPGSSTEPRPPTSRSAPSTEKDQAPAFAGAGAPGPTRNERAPVSPVAPTMIAPARTGSSTRESPFAPDGVVAPQVVVRVSNAPAPRGSPLAGREGGRRYVDRDAATRPSAPAGGTKRLARNDTQIDDGAPPLYPPLQEPVWEGHATANTTGPIAGEANTRPPPDRTPHLLVLAAAVFAVVVVGGATAYVKLAHRAAPAAAAAPPPVAPVPPPPRVVSSATAAPEPAPAASTPEPPKVAAEPAKAVPKAAPRAPSAAASGYSPPIKMD